MFNKGINKNNRIIKKIKVNKNNRLIKKMRVNKNKRDL